MKGKERRRGKSVKNECDGEESKKKRKKEEERIKKSKEIYAQ